MSESVARKIGDLTVTIDRSVCIGSGNCVKVAPDLFQLDDEATASFAPGTGSPSRTHVIETCQVCPVEALTVTDAGGEQIVP
jgi:ferredoxin